MTYVQVEKSYHENLIINNSELTVDLVDTLKSCEKIQLELNDIISSLRKLLDHRIDHTPSGLKSLISFYETQIEKTKESLEKLEQPLEKLEQPNE